MYIGAFFRIWGCLAVLNLPLIRGKKSTSKDAYASYKRQISIAKQANDLNRETNPTHVPKVTSHGQHLHIEPINSALSYQI